MDSNPPAARLREILDGVKASITGPCPAKIVSWDAATQKAVVQPLIKTARTGEDGSRVVETLAPVTNVPLLFPRGHTGGITWAVEVGDTVMLLPAGFAIDRWLVRGGIVDPEDNRKHKLTDSVALVGLYDFAHVPTEVATDGLTVHGDTIRLGSNAASDPVVRRSDLAVVVSALNAFIALYNAHVHATLGTPPAPPASTATTPACSTVVKAD